MLTAKVYEVLKSDIDSTRDKTIQYIKAKNMIMDYLEMKSNDKITSAKIQEMWDLLSNKQEALLIK